MKKLLIFLLFFLFITPPRIDFSSPSFAQSTGEATTAESNSSDSDDLASDVPLSAKAIEKQLSGPVDVKDIAAASGWVTSSGIADWLGPLAPLALSPFFGVACLSGMALWGPEWMTDNAVLGMAGPLKNEWMFGIFAALALLTSLPRLTKVSKPLAQAADRLETYAVIIILLVVKVTMSMNAPAADAVAMLDSTGQTTWSMINAGEPIIQFGIISFTLDSLLSIAMVINILVVNSVKFFFEFLVWLTPIPLLDAVFEVCNKSLCAGLMAVYAMSPTVATVLNLAILLVAALMLRWISRRVRFYRTMILDPILARLWSGFGQAKKPELIVFPQEEFGPFAAKSRLKLTADDDGYTLTDVNWWTPNTTHRIASEPKPTVNRGWIMHSLTMNDAGRPEKFRFSRRYSDAVLQDLLMQLKLESLVSAHESNPSKDAKLEFA